MTLAIRAPQGFPGQNTPFGATGAAQSRGGMTMNGAKTLKPAPHKGSGGSTPISVKPTGLSPSARQALAAAPNKSEFVRQALEAYVTGADIRERLARIEALLLTGYRPGLTPPLAPPGGADKVAQQCAALAAWVRDDD